MISHLDIYEHNNPTPIHSVKLNPPASSDGSRLERVMLGLLRNMRDDCYVVEREETST